MAYNSREERTHFTPGVDTEEGRRPPLSHLDVGTNEDPRDKRLREVFGNRARMHRPGDEYGN